MNEFFQFKCHSKEVKIGFVKQRIFHKSKEIDKEPFYLNNRGCGKFPLNFL